MSLECNGTVGLKWGGHHGTAQPQALLVMISVFSTVLLGFRDEIAVATQRLSLLHAPEFSQEHNKLAVVQTAANVKRSYSL